MASNTDILSPADHKSGSTKGMIVGVLVATLVAVAAGAVIGLQFSSMVAPSPVAENKSKKPEEEAEQTPVSSKYTGKVTIKALPPILTNLAAPKNAWVRMEASIIVNGEVEELDVMAAQISEDTLAYLRTLTMSDIEGGSGLAYLRSDIKERAVVRSQGKVVEIIIGSLVVE